MNASVRGACVAIFTIGHAALETAALPPPAVLSLVQALTVPTKLAALSSTLSPKLTPRCAHRPRLKHTCRLRLLGAHVGSCHRPPCTTRRSQE